MSHIKAMHVPFQLMYGRLICSQGLQSDRPKSGRWWVQSSQTSLCKSVSKTIQNRWCQLADFRERGGRSFELRAVASESDSPSGRSAIYYDALHAQFASLSYALLASARTPLRTPLRFNHKQLKPTPVIDVKKGVPQPFWLSLECFLKLGKLSYLI